MADRRVAIRLGTEGKATVVADLNDIGVTGDAAFNRVARAAAKAGRDAADAAANAERQMAKLNALSPGLNPARLDALAGSRSDIGKSAQASAVVFAASFADMEKRANALRAAIDPVFLAQQRFDREIAEARTLIASGAISLDDYSKRAWQLHQAVSAAAGQTDRAAGTIRRSGSAFASAAPQVQDFFVQVGMGANPLNALAVQGGQLAGQMIYLEGRAGSVARFFMGPWGLAAQVALMAALPLGKAVYDLATEDDRATEAAKRHAAALDKLREAVERLNGQQAIRSHNTRQGIKDDIDAAEAARLHEVRVRALLDAQLQQARNALGAAMQTQSSPGGSVPGGMFSAGVGQERDARAQIAALEGAIAINDRKRAEAEQATRTGERLLLLRDVAAETDKAASANQRYEDTMDRLNRQFDAGKLNKNTFTRLARDAEVAKQKALDLINEAKKAGVDGDTLTANSVAKMLRGALPGVHVTSTTGGQHVKNSYHYRGQAVDFVPAGGMSSMTKEDVRQIFTSRGIDIVELLGPGDKGHSDHFHVAWTKGKLALDEFNDAAKLAKDRQRDLDELTKAFDPAAAAADEYREALAKILRLNPANADGMRAEAWAKYVKKRADAFSLPGVEDNRAAYDAEDKADKERAERAKSIGEYAGRTLSDQQDRIALARRELALTGANDNFREAELEKLRTILDLRRNGVEAGSDDERQILANLDALTKLNTTIERQRVIWDEIKGVGGAALDRLFDSSSAETWGQRVKGVLGDLRNELIKLALLNPIKNWLLGESNPTLGGVFGKLFGDGGIKGASILPGDQPGFGIGDFLKNTNSIPKLASGTEYSSGGAALIGENGPEVAWLPRGSRVTSASETRRLFGGANDNAGASFHFDLRGAVVTADLLQQMNAIGDAAAARGAAGGAAMAGRNANTVQRRRLRG